MSALCGGYVIGPEERGQDLIIHVYGCPILTGSGKVGKGDLMTLSEQVQKDMTDAMKARDELRLSTLRMMRRRHPQRSESGAAPATREGS